MLLVAGSKQFVMNIASALLPDLPSSTVNSTSATADSNDDCTDGPQYYILRQFWKDTPLIGLKNEFSLHGLWPDLFWGVFNKTHYDLPPRFHFIKLFHRFHDYELYNYMKRNWPSEDERDEEFWWHEWAKHGSSIKSLRPECYGEHYTAGINIYDYFLKATELFLTLPTYKWLTEANIYPTTKKIYDVEEIQNVLAQKFQAVPAVKGDDFLSFGTVSYCFFVNGNFKTATFIPTDYWKCHIRCSSELLLWLPK